MQNAIDKACFFAIIHSEIKINYHLYHESERDLNMRKTHMICYGTAVIGFYIAEVLLYMSTSSITGLTLLAMSILSLAAGVFIHCRINQIHTVTANRENTPEAVHAGAAC